MEIVIPSGPSILLYLGSALALLLIPGPAVLYVVTRSMTQGRTAGLVSDLGIHSATLVHIAAATLGISALLASSTFAFSLVKYAGSAYLIFLGLKKLLCRVDDTDIGALLPRSYARLFRDGFIVNLLNPKTALFFLAFLPQFVEPDRGSIAVQVGFLGVLFALLGLITDGCYALIAAVAVRPMRQNRYYVAGERYVSSSVLIGLGVMAALSGGGKK